MKKCTYMDGGIFFEGCNADDLMRVTDDVQHFNLKPLPLGSRVIVAGGRDFDDYPKLKEVLDNIGYWMKSAIIVNGTAKGADTLGGRYAKEHGIDMLEFPADWDTHGKKAGILRNIQMGDDSDALVVCWDGKSKGTRHMINYAIKKKLQVTLIRY